MVLQASPPSVQDIILSYFDVYQRTDAEQDGSIIQQQILSSSTKSLSTRLRHMSNENDYAESVVMKLKEELITVKILTGEFQNGMSVSRRRSHSESLTCNECGEMDQILFGVKNTILQITHAVFASVISSSKKNIRVPLNQEPVTKILHLIAIFAFSEGDGSLAQYLLAELINFATVEAEAFRVVFCKFLGTCLFYTMGDSNGNPHSTQWEDRGMSTRIRENASIISTFLSISRKEENNHQIEWRKSCIRAIIAIIQPRLVDKCQAVRLAALESCQHLFNTEEYTAANAAEYEELVKAMLFSVSHDPSVNNRSMAILCIPILPETIPAIIERIRDAKDKVRVNALEILRKKSNVNSLTVEQRVEILSSGLTQRCQRTYEATVKLICCQWMKALKFDPIATLRLFDPYSHETICEMLVKAMISVGSDDENIFDDLSNNEISSLKDYVLKPYGIVPVLQLEAKETSSNLDPAKILYIRVLYEETIASKTLPEVQKAIYRSKMIPDITVLGDALLESIDRLKIIQSRQTVESIYDDTSNSSVHIEKDEESECFVCLQLLRLAQITDLKEEGSRRYFSPIINRILCSSDTHADLISECVHVMAVLHDTEHHFLQSISEILADMFDADNSLEGLPCVSDRTERCLRCIEILSVALEKIGKTNNPIFRNFSSVILTSITDVSLGSLVRESAVSCLARFVILLDECDIIEKFKPLLMEIVLSKNEKVDIRAQAVLALCDLSLLHERLLAPTTLNRGGDERVTTSVSDLFLQNIMGSDRAMVLVVAECAAKLHYAGKIYDANILAHLMMIYFDRNYTNYDVDVFSDEVKDVGSPARLQQLLSIFFPAYCIKSTTGRLTLLASIISMLGLVNDKMGRKSKGNRSFVWPVTKMVEYICESIDNGQTHARKGNANLENTGHDINLGLEVALIISHYLVCDNDIISTPYVRSLCKILGNINNVIKDTGEKVTLVTLKRNVDQLLMLITDDISIRSLESLENSLEGVDLDDDISKSKDLLTAQTQDNLDTSTATCLHEVESMVQQYQISEVQKEESTEEENSIGDSPDKSFGSNVDDMNNQRKSESSSLKDSTNQPSLRGVSCSRFSTKGDTLGELTLPTIVSKEDCSKKKRSNGELPLRNITLDRHSKENLPTFATVGICNPTHQSTTVHRRSNEKQYLGMASANENDSMLSLGENPLKTSSVVTKSTSRFLSRRDGQHHHDKLHKLPRNSNKAVNSKKVENLTGSDCCLTDSSEESPVPKTPLSRLRRLSKRKDITPLTGRAPNRLRRNLFDT